MSPSAVCRLMLLVMMCGVSCSSSTVREPLDPDVPEPDASARPAPSRDARAGSADTTVAVDLPPSPGESDANGLDGAVDRPPGGDADPATRIDASAAGSPEAGADGPPAIAGPPTTLDCNAVSADLPRTNAVKSCDRSLPKLYCDGRVLAFLAVKPEVPLLLGMGPNMKDPLPGDLDVVRFYNRALTAAEIAAHARKEYAPCTLADGCAIELDFDAKEGAGFKDTGSAAVPTKINGTVDTVPGVRGNAAHFDGKGWVEIPHQPALVFTHQFSFEAWIRSSAGCLPGATCEFMRIFDKSNGLRLDRHAGGLRFQNTAWWFHGPGIEDKKGVWIHLAVTFDYERGVVYYRDGRENKSCRL